MPATAIDAVWLIRARVSPITRSPSPASTPIRVSSA